MCQMQCIVYWDPQPPGLRDPQSPSVSPTCPPHFCLGPCLDLPFLCLTSRSRSFDRYIEQITFSQ